MLLAAGQTYTSPCSGNAYSRWLLQRMSPIGGDKWMDTLTEIHAPFEGEVKTLTTPANLLSDARLQLYPTLQT